MYMLKEWESHAVLWVVEYTERMSKWGEDGKDDDKNEDESATFIIKGDEDTSQDTKEITCLYSEVLLSLEEF